MKKKIRKLSTAMMALILVLMSGNITALSSTAGAGKDTAYRATFNDTENHWAKGAVDKWSNYGVIQGYNGAFNPNGHITRAEFSVIIDKIMKYIEVGENIFADLATENWYYEAMLKLYSAGVIKGTAGNVLPNAAITRQEAAVIVTRAFDIPLRTSGVTTFKDENKIAQWAINEVKTLHAQKIINGSPDGSFKPLNFLTRAEAVTIFNNFVQLLISEPGEYRESVVGSVVVNSTDTVLSDMKISGNLYVTQGVADGEVTLNNVEITGSVIVRGGGENSITFNNVDVKGALVINKNDGKVRILATGNTSVSVTTLKSGGMLVTKELTGGGFEQVEISADVLAGHQIVLDGSFNQVTNYATSTQITANGTIKELVTTVDTNLKGNAVIEKIVTENDSKATINDQPVSENPPSTGGGGGGAPIPTISVESVTINQEKVELFIGDTVQLTATILPTNATNKALSWSVEDEAIATISQQGLVTAVAEGETTINVVTIDGSKTARLAVAVAASVVDELDPTEVFEEIELQYLSSNTNADNVVTDLKLMTALSNYPEVLISWASSNPIVVSNTGGVVRDAENDLGVTLTATLSGSVEGTKEFIIIVKAKEKNEVEISYGDADPYFEEGYPQAYIQDDQIWVKFKLKQPAEVFMVVNAANGSWESSVQSVLQGHAGNQNYAVYVDSWPYFNVNDSSEIKEFNTGVRLSSYSGEARVEFVIQDKENEYLSNEVTTILFEQEVISWIDTYPPFLQDAYINKELNTIYVYYDQELDEDSKPSTSDFTLNYGNVSNVEIVNDFNKVRMGFYIRLEVSGLSNNYKNNLLLSYHGNTVQDVSDVKNKAYTFSNFSIKYIEEKITQAVISSDRMLVVLEITPGFVPSGGLNEADRFQIEIENGETFTLDPNVSYNYSFDRMRILLRTDSPLPTGSLTVKMDTRDIQNWAFDRYPDELVSEEVVEISAPGIPVASYNNGEILLSFEKDSKLNFYNIAGANFVLKIDGVECIPRGFNVRRSWPAQNELIIDFNEPYSSHFKEAIEQGLDIQIKYSKLSDHFLNVIRDELGVVVDNFDYIKIIKK